MFPCGAVTQTPGESQQIGTTWKGRVPGTKSPGGKAGEVAGGGATGTEVPRRERLGAGGMVQRAGCEAVNGDQQTDFALPSLADRALPSRGPCLQAAAWPGWIGSSGRGGEEFLFGT